MFGMIPRIHQERICIAIVSLIKLAQTLITQKEKWKKTQQLV